ncbi:hypothetical protein ACOMHN_066299 [Nucella lapillus]
MAGTPSIAPHNSSTDASSTDTTVKIPFRGIRPIRTEGVVRNVEKGKLFGLVQCDVEVPDHLRDFFAEMPPIFKNVDVGLDDSILAETFKLLGNSAYGKTVPNIARHCDVFYLDGATTSSAINDLRFIKLTPLGTDLTEVELSKKIIRWNLPIQIGCYVYQNVKLRLFQSYYDYMARFVPKENFQLCEMDTDSLYMALSSESLDSAVEPELRERFYREYKDWFPSQACKDHEEEFVLVKIHDRPWNPPPCCRHRAA